MVLVIISTTLALFLGVDDSLKQRYPSEYDITCKAEENDAFDKSVQALHDSAESEGLTLINELSYRDFSFSAIYEKSKDFFVTDPGLYSNLSAMQKYNQLVTFVVVPLEDYNKAMGKNETLGENEVLVYSSRQELPVDTDQRIRSIPPREENADRIYAKWKYCCQDFFRSFCGRQRPFSDR